MTGIWQECPLAARSLGRRPVVPALTASMLALSLASTTALFSIARGALLAPLPYPDADRLVAIWESDARRSDHRVLVAPGHLLSWLERSQTIESVSLYRVTEATVVAGDHAERLSIGRITRILPLLVGPELLAGRLPAAEEYDAGADIAVLTETAGGVLAVRRNRGSGVRLPSTAARFTSSA